MTIYSLKTLNRPLLNKKIRHFTYNNKYITDNLILDRLFVMIMKHLDLKWHQIINLRKSKWMEVVFNYIIFLWACSYLSLKISAIWLADEKVLNQLENIKYFVAMATFLVQAFISW